TVTYTADDGNGGTSDPVTVTVTVTGTNDAPTAVADTRDAAPDATQDLGNVLANDTDPDSAVLNVDSVNGDSANVGAPIAADNGGLVTI
ncbi:Ig-like domain-containing protein, partial [Loktanella sp. SALINAS62]|uniref:Ig-like domain-containing protein n=1 Tax=Loktanella sp. SALINAS62 TaxID=2706124 RepID=UPI002010FA7C